MTKKHNRFADHIWVGLEIVSVNEPNKKMEALMTDPTDSDILRFMAEAIRTFGLEESIWHIDYQVEGYGDAKTTVWHDDLMNYLNDGTVVELEHTYNARPKTREELVSTLFSFIDSTAMDMDYCLGYYTEITLELVKEKVLHDMSRWVMFHDEVITDEMLDEAWSRREARTADNKIKYAI